MLELPFLMLLVISVCFLTYEFFKVNSAYQQRIHYFRFLPSLNTPEISKELYSYTKDSAFKSGLTDINLRMREMQSRIERQEAVIEKLIKGLAD